jgi:hypothetical protein
MVIHQLLLVILCASNPADVNDIAERWNQISVHPDSRHLLPGLTQQQQQQQNVVFKKADGCRVTAESRDTVKDTGEKLSPQPSAGPQLETLSPAPH